MANGIGDALINIGAGLMDRHTRELEAKRLRDARLEERKYQEDMAFKMNEANNAARAALEDKKAANKRLEMLNKPPTVTSVSGGYLISGQKPSESDPNTPEFWTEFNRTAAEKPAPSKTQAVLGNDGQYHVIDLLKLGKTGIMGQPRSGARTDKDMLALDEAKLRQRKLLDAQLRLEAVDSMSAGEVAKALGKYSVKPAEAEAFRKSKRAALEAQIKLLSSGKQGSSKSSGSWIANAFGGLMGVAATPVDKLAIRAAEGDSVTPPAGAKFDFKKNPAEWQRTYDAAIKAGASPDEATIIADGQDLN